MIKIVSDLVVTLNTPQIDFVETEVGGFVDAMAQKRQSAEYYRDNRATTVSKALKDTYLGKKAEIMTVIALRENYNFPNIKIDLAIRQGRAKGWTVDLPYKEIDKSFPNVHVKACNRDTFNYCNDFSWTFQASNKNGHGGKDTLLDSDADDLVALVFMETLASNTGYIKAVLPFSELKPLLKDPVKESLKGIKKCLYYKDLKEAFVKRPQIKVIKKNEES